jgi:hypothetical protein
MNGRTVIRRRCDPYELVVERYTDAAHLATAATSGMDTGLAEALDKLGDHLER